jgi:hypothetical protein
VTSRTFNSATRISIVRWSVELGQMTMEKRILTVQLTSFHYTSGTHYVYVVVSTTVVAIGALQTDERKRYRDHHTVSLL